MAKNNAKNVSVTKGVRGGYFFIAPKGAELPAGNKEALSDEFMNMGFCGDDGVSFTDSSSVTKYYDMNGDTIASEPGEVQKGFKVTFREIKADTLSVMYGKDNVKVEGGTISVSDKGAAADEWSVVMELLLKDGRKWRRVAPCVSVESLGDMSAGSKSLAGREVSFAAMMDYDSGCYYIDYYDSTEEAAPVSGGVE